MDFKVSFSPTARLDLREIVRYISLENEQAAERIGKALLSAAKNLSKFPRKGRIVPEFGIDSLREVHLPPYRIIYRVFEDPQTVEIIRIWHASRGTPKA
ncbi:type II toxin-antitoxin system RelE/ParE family toxin [Puniceicoccaceae bacterium K14]|nr:type II toxin-antitoxin system RelE/ParE family toxin [Puniceicoccaceae bacterium K14]